MKTAVKENRDATDDISFTPYLWLNFAATLINALNPSVNASSMIFLLAYF